MKKILLVSIVALVSIATVVSIYAFSDHPVWGFYGHRKINRMAVFALPSDMIGFYKKNIEYVTEHAVDPDKRRYATKHEAVRHYIDVDHWDVIPFDKVPKEFRSALLKYGQWQLIDDAQKDTVVLQVIEADENALNLMHGEELWLTVDEFRFKEFFNEAIYTQYYEEDWVVSGVDFDAFFNTSKFENSPYKVRFEDRFSHQGILPYHLETMFYQLIKAFRNEDVASVLRLSSDYGHYIADAHVPLHTTVNYNGQLTDQVGIHAFWESRLPELFAEAEYDFLVGRADYIGKPRDYFWGIVTDSHRLLDSVLIIEKRLSQNFPSDQQYCYDERLSRTVRIECEAYASAYHDAMDDMVETRMQDAIKSVASVWYSAWADAGQPDLNSWVDKNYEKPEEFKRHSVLGGGTHDTRE